jgi:hypothetical protein
LIRQSAESLVGTKESGHPDSYAREVLGILENEKYLIQNMALAAVMNYFCRDRSRLVALSDGCPEDSYNYGDYELMRWRR